MRNISLVSKSLVSFTILIGVCGCPNGITIPVTIEQPLGVGGAAGLQFAVQPDVTQTVVTTFPVNTEGRQIVGGTFELKPEAITIQADNVGKQAQTLQGTGGTITVVGRVALPGMEDDVCNSTDEYPPYVVTFDAGFQITAVNPSTITLSPNTVAAINSGSVTLCLEVTAPFSGVVTVSTLTVNVLIPLSQVAP